MSKTAFMDNGKDIFNDRRHAEREVEEIHDLIQNKEKSNDDAKMKAEAFQVVKQQLLRGKKRQAFMFGFFHFMTMLIFTVLTFQ